MAMEHKTISRSSGISHSKDNRTISGFIPLFRQLKGNDGSYERFDRRAFDGAKMDDCVLALNHNLDNAVAGVRNKTLEFQFNDDGLVWRADILDTSKGDDLLKEVRTGLASQCSLRFWHEPDAVEIERTSEGNSCTVFKSVYSLMDLAPTPQGHWGAQTLSRTNTPAALAPKRGGILALNLAVLKLKKL